MMVDSASFPIAANAFGGEGVGEGGNKMNYLKSSGGSWLKQ